MNNSAAIILVLALGASSVPACAVSAPDDDVFTLTIENDSLGSGADRNYTSGVQLNWLEHAAQPSLVARAINDLIPFNMLNDSTTLSTSIGQNLYTPNVITAPVPDPKDRPYAGFLYTSIALAATNGNHADTIELTAGLVGPMALGREAQQLIHTMLDAPQPQGWNHQLKNEPGLMASWERLWPDTLYAEMGDVAFRATPYTGATLGNMFTYANSGIIFQWMPKSYPTQGTPVRIRPALPGKGYTVNPEGEFAWSIFAGLEGRAMGRNLFLDGNTFADSPSVDKKPFVADTTIGIAFNYGRAQANYTLNWRSQEFYGQDNTDLFGSVGLSCRF